MTQTMLHWSIGREGRSTSHGETDEADGGVPPAVELSADIDIRQNRYQGWHPVAGTWDPRAAPFNTHQTVQVRPNGTAFGMQPACGAFPGQGNVTGFQGRRLVNSKNRNLGTLIGELQSQVFTIASGGIDFLIGGGDFADVTCLNLYVQRRRRLAAGAHRHRGAQPGTGAARLGRGRVPRPASLPADPRLCSR